jgi:Ni/Co efflux regulator RcnB
MFVLTKGMLTIGLIGALAAPAFAQRHDNDHGNRGPQRMTQHRELPASRGHKWSKGQRLAPAQRRYVVSDWNQRGLRAPPRGYQWVRENNNAGDYILVAAATGIIASILSQ